MMTDEQFEELWQRAECEQHAKRLTAQYPAWRAKRRRATGIAMASVALVAIVVPLTMQGHLQHEQYAKVYCNRTGIADQQWVDLAAEMILES